MCWLICLLAKDLNSESLLPAGVLANLSARLLEAKSRNFLVDDQQSSFCNLWINWQIVLIIKLNHFEPTWDCLVIVLFPSERKKRTFLAGSCLGMFRTFFCRVCQIISLWHRGAATGERATLNLPQFLPAPSEKGNLDNSHFFTVDLYQQLPIEADSAYIPAKKRGIGSPRVDDAAQGMISCQRLSIARNQLAVLPVPENNGRSPPKREMLESGKKRRKKLKIKSPYRAAEKDSLRRSCSSYCQSNLEPS